MSNLSIITIILNIALIGLFFVEMGNLRKSLKRKKKTILHLLGSIATGMSSYLLVCVSLGAEISNVNLIKGVVILAIIMYFVLVLESLFVEK